MRWCALTAALAVSGAAAAQAPSRELLEQKEALVRRLLEERSLEVARSLHARALEHMTRGELKLAEARLDEAMRAIGRARRLSPDAAQRAEQERLRHEARAASIESLRRAYAQRLADGRDAPEPDSPRAQYRHELERNRSYAALVPVALEELRPAGGALQLVQRYVETSEALVSLAARQAESADWPAALGSVQSATTYLQRALGAAGLVVPQAMNEERGNE